MKTPVRHPHLSPFNKFLIAKEMTLSELAKLNAFEESVFFDEYAAWKKINCPGVEI
jgi:hypothetical protein